MTALSDTSAIFRLVFVASKETKLGAPLIENVIVSLSGSSAAGNTVSQGAVVHALVKLKPIELPITDRKVGGPAFLFLFSSTTFK